MLYNYLCLIYKGHTFGSNSIKLSTMLFKVLTTTSSFLFNSGTFCYIIINTADIKKETYIKVNVKFKISIN